MLLFVFLLALSQMLMGRSFILLRGLLLKLHSPEVEEMLCLAHQDQELRDQLAQLNPLLPPPKELHMTATGTATSCWAPLTSR